MSEKANFSFLFSFHRRMYLSYILCGFLALSAVIATIAVKMIQDRRSKIAREKITPKVNTERWKKDFLLFHDKAGRFPKDLRELEIILWNDGDPKKSSLLTNGPQLYLFDNYLYLYYSNGGQGQVCSLWAVPVGELKNEAQTFYLLLTPKSYQLWKGLPLTDSDLERIPKKAVPLDTELARLGMSRQLLDDDKIKKDNILTPFGKK